MTYLRKTLLILFLFILSSSLINKEGNEPEKEESALNDLDFETNGDYFFNVDNTGSDLLIYDQYASVINCADWNAEIQESWYCNNVYSSSARVNAEVTKLAHPVKVSL